MQLKDSTYFITYSWMVNELNLKTVERDVFAIIYGFCQDGKSDFHGSLSYISTLTGYSRNSICAALNKLTEKHLLNKQERSINNIKYCSYTVNFEGVQGTCTGVQGTCTGVQGTCTGVQGTCTNNIDNKIERKSFLSKDKNDRQKAVTEAHVEKFLRLYDRHCSNLPKVRGITDKRKQAIRKICGKYSFEEITNAFDMANESAFLTGNNDRGWKANIDFILREDKFVSILEGKYGGKKQTKRTFTESGAEHVQSFDEEDQKKLEQFQEKLKKDGKQIFF